MNNLITINFADPIREEYNQAIDKTAALNTIAFKYFKGDRIEAHNYLSDNYIAVSYTHLTLPTIYTV